MDAQRQGNLHGVIFLVVWWWIGSTTPYDLADSFLVALCVAVPGIILVRQVFAALRDKPAVLAMITVGVVTLGLWLYRSPLTLTYSLAVALVVGLTMFVCGYIESWRWSSLAADKARRWRWLAYLFVLVAAVLAAAYFVVSFKDVSERVWLAVSMVGVPFVFGCIAARGPVRKAGDAHLATLEDFTRSGVSRER